MKICTACQKTHNDDMKFCSNCGHALTANANAYAACGTQNNQEVTASVNTAASAMPSSAFEKILARFWPLIAAILGYAISWLPDSSFCYLGTLAAVAAAVASWLKPEGKVLCKSIAIRIVTSVIGFIALIEFLIYAA